MAGLADNDWIIGSPGFPKVSINGFIIEAPDVSAENIYPQSITLDGVKLEGNVLHHAQLKPGSKLVVKMGAMPVAR